MTNPFPCFDCERSFNTEEGLSDHRRVKHSGGQTTVASLDPSCIECGETAKLVNGDAIYPHRPDLYGKRFWLCECGAYCGCHGVTTRPLGNPCGPDTRRARMTAHEAFDPIWRGREMDRRAAYAWLSEQMGLPSEKTHIGMMTRDQAIEVVRHCRARERIAA